MHTYNEYQLNKSIITICEGPSESAYLMEVNKVFREEGIKTSFIPRISASGHFLAIKQKFSLERKNNKSTEIIIWADNDIYKRNDSNNEVKYNSKQGLPDFKFNYYNFEDMLILHMDDNLIATWQNICLTKKHFTSPLSSDVHEKLFKENICPEYQKGTIPIENFSLNIIKKAIKNNNNKDILFKSDFLFYLEKLI